MIHQLQNTYYTYKYAIRYCVIDGDSWEDAIRLARRIVRGFE